MLRAATAIARFLPQRMTMAAAAAAGLAMLYIAPNAAAQWDDVPGYDLGFMGIGIGLHLRKHGGAFTPASLYRPGDILLWYDPSDLSTMFKDTAGTQPVTADGDSVALMLDKGQWGGKTLSQVLAGQAEMLPTPSAAASSVGWGRTAGGAAASLAAGVFSATGTGSGTVTSGPDLSVTTGQMLRYRIRVRTTTGTYGVNLSWRRTSALGSPLVTDRIITLTTNYLEYTGYFLSPVTATDVVFSIRHSGTGTVEFEADVSVKEIPGYHRVQATGTSMPKYKTGPNPAAAENSPELVTNGGFAADIIGWGDLGPWTAGSAVWSSGAIEVTVSSFQGAAQGLSGLTIGATYRIKAEVTAVSTGKTGRLYVGGSTNPGSSLVLNQSALSVGAYEFLFTATATEHAIGLSSTDGAGTIAWDNISIKEIPASAPYIHWLLYDGTDDGHATRTITWGTDEVAICAGVMKSSDSGAAPLVESSASSSTNAGSFAIFAPYTNSTANYGFRSRGSASSDAASAGYAAPTTNVLTGQGKIPTVSTLRADGAQVATSATDQGSGNYGSHVLNFGRRNNASLPFNGREYQTVIRSRLLSAAELSKLETFVAAKTGVIL